MSDVKGYTGAGADAGAGAGRTDYLQLDWLDTFDLCSHLTAVSSMILLSNTFDLI